MKKIVVYSLAFFFMGCCASEHSVEQPPSPIITDFPGFAQAWANAAVSDLTREELELLGTFLYYDMAASHYELSLRNSLLDLQRGSQVLAFKIMNQDSPEQAATLCTQLSQIIDKIEKEITPSRNYFVSCWQLCDKEIEQSSYQNLTTAVAQLKQLSQRSLNNWSKENKEEIIKILEKNSQVFEDNLKRISIGKNTLDQLIDGTFPLSQETELVDIQIVHNALGVSHIMYEALFRASLATDEIMGISFGLISLNTIIFGTLYQEFYRALQERNELPMHIVIDEHGLLSVDSRTKILPEFSFNTSTNV